MVHLGEIRRGPKAPYLRELAPAIRTRGCLAHRRLVQVPRRVDPAQQALLQLNPVGPAMAEEHQQLPRHGLLPDGLGMQERGDHRLLHLTEAEPWGLALHLLRLG